DSHYITGGYATSHDSVICRIRIETKYNSLSCSGTHRLGVSGNIWRLGEKIGYAECRKASVTIECVEKPIENVVQGVVRFHGVRYGLLSIRKSRVMNGNGE